MRPIIHNRDFQHPADGWYQIETPGEHENTQAGVVQVIDGTAANSIVKRFNQEADGYQSKHGTPFPGMLVDHEHFKHDPDKETRAYGWLMRLENRNGIPFGQINWTNTGKAAVDGGDYRFFSSEYDPRDLVVLDNGQKPVRVRPMRLDGLTLTNDPNNKGGAPITNRAGAANSKSNQDDHLDDPFPTPALDEWFRAVAAVEKSAAINGEAALNYATCWEMARQQFPKLYAAAFGAAEKFNPADATDSQAASEQVGVLANRITKAACSDSRFGWNFVRENLPALFNRMLTRSEVILNRENENQNPQVVQNKAAALFSRLASVVQATSSLKPGLTLEQAYQNVRVSHPALAKLAEGSLTMDEACAQEPELRTRLA
jgi:phage I-like protein